MNNKLAPLIEKMQSSFWFVPSFMIVLSFFIAVLTIYIDSNSELILNSSLGFIYAMDVEAIRSLLGTIAGSMITVTSIAFSITVVILTLASSQFGPGLMRNFMMDKGTQFVLGTFISTFLFCIIIFFAMSFEGELAFEPGISVLIAIVMTCSSVCILIFFIHHIAKSIQAEVVIDNVYCELHNNIEKIFPTVLEEKSVQPDLLLDNEKNDGFISEVYAPVSGYLQVVDKESLIKLAIKEDCEVKLNFSAGNFIVAKTVMATIHSSHQLTDETIKDEVIKNMLLGACRTPVQDPEFAVRQLVEIALRALSPGINDPYTAIACIDKLCAVLCNLTDKVFPQTNVLSDGKVRLVCKELTYTDIATAAFDQIRQDAETNLAVTIRMLDSLYILMPQCLSEEQRNFVLAQTEMIKTQQDKQSMSDDDRHNLLTRIEKITDYKQ
ncbi:DUF2254 domain-containing protein [Colwellia sp. E2M01]|uniref:DUF2254 domain-containing protein n=1 Tax=Colwellia sp. E2M01 TaxID=2841561 RepID=UPI001C09195B|nr:DUF2254 domain-containing protein [Colwellia sp. E2M01]MBU2869636.1 DUF2254 domain-containing protein [Colwellia sp. E2M01]